MTMESKSVSLLLLISANSLILTRTHYIHDISRNKILGRNRRLDTVHNVTIECPRKTPWRCQRYLSSLTKNGYPWSPLAGDRNPRRNPNVTGRPNNLRDALDSINRVCYLHDRTRRCLEESGFQDFCLASGAYGSLRIPIDFQFTCHHRQRDENLVRSLQCLYDSRVLVMLYLHMMDRCRGIDILDEIMTRNKNSYFYTLDISPPSQVLILLRLNCVPKSIISTCIRGIVEDHCGAMTADFVQDYIVYLQDRYADLLHSAGLSSNICDLNITTSMLPSNLPIQSDYTNLRLSRLLEVIAHGTALDTVWGKFLRKYIPSLSGEELCNIDYSSLAYFTCVMSADDTSEKSRFNIIQFAHGLLPLVYHGTRCNRLGQFTTCWNLLQQICGPKVRGLEQHATLLVEGCKIQSEMDTVGCHWQDMLLPHYFLASRETMWPTVVQCLATPMFLESGRYSSFNSIMEDLDTVISLLQPGLDEISIKCGPQPVERLRLLFSKLRYLQRDALKYRHAFISRVIKYSHGSG